VFAVDENNFVVHPRIRRGLIEARDYQLNIARAAARFSTLVVLPTGLGKTVIALFVIAEVLEKKPADRKVLFLAPTKPLVEQHASFLRETLVDPGGVVVFTGEVKPEKRGVLWEENRIICSTPQVIVNDILAGRISLDSVALVVFDEAHRAVGDYAYVFIGEEYQKVPGGLVLAMTASPGSSVEKIMEVCGHLGIEHVEIRSKYDADVIHYVQSIEMHWVRVDVPLVFREVIRLLKKVLAEMVEEMRRFGITFPGGVTTKELLAAGERIRARIKEEPRSSSLYQAAVCQAAAVKINHAIELAETQGLHALRAYMEKMVEESRGRRSSRSTRLVVSRPEFKKIMELLAGADVEHPKMRKVVEIVASEIRRNPGARIIVFTHYRETSELVTRELEKVGGVRPARFVGQASRGEDRGMNQKRQVETIKKFREGVYNVLVATSVAEEGLDIPSTDLVVFYEPVPSEIRTIQRRGRTGRRRRGKVVILITRGTRDEGYYWSSHRKEKEMHRQLQRLRQQLSKHIRVGDIYAGGGGRTARASPMAADGVASGGAHDWSGRVVDGGGSGDEIGGGAAGDKKKKRKKKKAGQATLFDFFEDDGNSGDGDGVGGEDGGGESHEGNNGRCGGGGVEYGEEMRADTGETGGDDGKKGGAHMEADTKDEKKLVVDNREMASGVVRALYDMGYTLEPCHMEAGDYAVSSTVGVERKTAEDFLSSLIDGRLFPQIASLSSAYLEPVLVVEGRGLYERRGVGRKAVMGALASIVTDFGVPAVFTSGPRETAEFIDALWTRKKRKKKGDVRGMRKQKPSPASSAGLRDSMLFILEGLPGVSRKTAIRLLDHFGTPLDVMSASVEDLMGVRGIGEKTAGDIYRVARGGGDGGLR